MSVVVLFVGCLFGFVDVIFWCWGVKSFCFCVSEWGNGWLGWGRMVNWLNCDCGLCDGLCGNLFFSNNVMVIGMCVYWWILLWFKCCVWFVGFVDEELVDSFFVVVVVVLYWSIIC